MVTPRAPRQPIFQKLFAGLALAITSVFMLPAMAQANLSDALSGGTVNADMRYRYELVDQDGAAKDANASTLRSRLGYHTGSVSGVSLFLEFENITALMDDRYNSGVNGKGSFPVVADPTGSEINQAHLTWKRKNIAATLGRQRIKLDNLRHVGNVGWRQNEQTYDAATINGKADRLSYHYSYLWNVNDVKFGNTDVESHLLNLRYNGPELGSLAVYSYLINNNSSPGASSQTYGGRYQGLFDVGPTRIALNVEHATQGDFQDAAFKSVDYRLGELGITAHGITAKSAYEVLEGSGSRGFQTPLATLHAFNGWVDRFLTTPGAGLRDISFTLAAQAAGIKLKAVYHDFSSDTGGEYGTEIDLLAVKPMGAYSVGVKYGFYDAAGTLGDTDVAKGWLFAQVKI